MITDNAKFLKLVLQDAIMPSLKTYSDTILFYYLGHLATSNTDGEISEIGVGGSTYPLMELAEAQNKIFFIVDNDEKNVNRFVDSQHWPKAKLQKNLIDSADLPKSQITTQFSYCHVDGSKNFTNTVSDVEFYLTHLSTNGLICQDDYGNNKWPTVTDAIKYLEFQGKIKIILVGDSSAWFTKPEYYDYWMCLLNQDYEFSLLKAVCNICNSSVMEKSPEYFFLQAILNTSKKENYSESELNYFNNLIELDAGYLTMPYPGQSKFGIFLKPQSEYFLTDIYSSLRGPSWPEYPPTTRSDIEQLPDWIKSELKNYHNIDIYKKNYEPSTV